MPDLRALLQQLTPNVPLPEGLNTSTSANGIDAAGDVLVYVPPNVDVFQGGGGGPPFLPIEGGTLTGPLILAGNPVVPLGAATMQYVDGAVARAGGPFLPLAGGGTITNAFLRLDGPAGTNRPLVFSTNLSNRWQLLANNLAETGGNVGSDLALGAFSDTGGFIGTALALNRASGPTGQSGPYIYTLAPWRQLAVRGSTPNNVVGNWQSVGPQDREPVMPLPANPLSTTAGSAVVTITWPGSCAPGNNWIGPPGFGTETYINLQGATAVGGITPVGWFQVSSIVNNDQFTIVWTANATATATGGGAACTAQPSHITTLNRVQSQITSGGDGFPGQTAELYEVIPDFIVPQGNPAAPRYEQRWHWTVGPSDPNGLQNYAITGIEWDLTHRGRDWGYQPNLYRAINPSMAFWVGPVVVPPWATGGGTPINWGTVYTVFSGESEGLNLGTYQAFSTMPNALVGQAFDPTGHGGVGVDLFGAWTVSPYANPIVTTLGSAVVSMSVHPANIAGVTAGAQVYIPNVYVVNGVTVGGGTYTIGAVDLVGATFTVTGTGNATASGAGGGPNGSLVLSFVQKMPYAPAQFWGGWQHGIVTDPGSRFLSNAIIETQPGNAILWGDGTGRATVSTTAASTPGNFDLTLSPAGTGRVAVSSNNVTLLGTTGDTTLNIFGANNTNRNIYFRTGSVLRWGISADQTFESGGNAGSPFAISRYADAGNWLGNPLTINRATGAVTIPGSLMPTLVAAANDTAAAAAGVPVGALYQNAGVVQVRLS